VDRQRLQGEIRNGEVLRDLARVPYVSEQLLREIAAGKSLADLWGQVSPQDVREKMLSTGVLMQAEEWEALPNTRKGRPLWREADVVRNQTDRVAGATAGSLLFSVPARFYAPGVGLWFALRANAVDPFLPCVRYLADSGIGGKRSVGLGHFAIPIPELHEITLPAAPDPKRFMVMSRYVPEAGEIFAEDPQGSYRVVPWCPRNESRGAAPGLPIFKGRIWVVQEGSVVVPRVPGREVYGGCMAVRGPAAAPGSHSMYHNGATIPVFLPAEKAHG
jgi:CRISPR type III-A-associated RAMP protein Csm4